MIVVTIVETAQSIEDNLLELGRPVGQRRRRCQVSEIGGRESIDGAGHG